MTDLVRHFLNDDTGQDLIEYGLLALLISIVAWQIYLAIGGDVTALYEVIRAGVSPAAGS